MQPTVFIPLSLSWLLFLPSCTKKAEAPPPPPPAAVTFQPAAAEDITITREYPGRIDAIRTAQVRARVPGILLEKTFEEGADVKAGDLLFKIDPEPLRAARDSAAATLARAEANELLATVNANRLRGLAESHAVSQQDLDNAEINLRLSAAEILGAKAALKTAELNLSYADVTAPISGRIGRAIVTEGALVGQGDATLLAVIQQLDPIYFDFTQPSSEIVALKRAMEAGALGKVPADQVAVTLILEDGGEYEKTGRILFSEVSVDETTGMVTLRAEFPNENRLLLPGMFARIRVPEAVRKDAVTIPQRAVTRVQGGKGSILVVDDTDHARMRLIETAEGVDGKWVVTSGLKAGERVIMEGHVHTKPDSPVKPEPFVEKTAPGDAAPEGS